MAANNNAGPARTNQPWLDQGFEARSDRKSNFILLTMARSYFLLTGRRDKFDDRDLALA
jgi:hypothetical protein